MAFTPEEKLKEFPCNFNLETGNKVSQQRLKHVKFNLKNDMESDWSVEEIIRNKNLLSCVLFRLDKKGEASKLNEEVLNLTNRTNMTALGNFIFISCKKGYVLKAETVYKDELVSLKENPDFEVRRYEALAEQAYSYSRLGGLTNYNLCIGLFQKCTERYPEKYLWKFGLGLIYRRMTNCNLYSSSTVPLNMDELTSKCTKLLLDVGKSGDTKIRALAYSQLVSLRQYMHSKEHNHFFDNQNIWQLMEQAIKYGGENPSVLTQCGKSFKAVHIDKAIELLRKSLTLKENGVAYHHLGLCLIKKASLHNTKEKVRRSLEFSSPGNSYESKQRIRRVNSSDTSASNQRQRNQHFYESKDSGFYSRVHTGCNSENNTTSADSSSNQSMTPMKRTSNCDQCHVHQPFPETSHAQDLGNKKPYLQHSLSVGGSGSQNDIAALKSYAKSPTKQVDPEHELVKEAIECYKRCILITHDNNIPAKLSLGDVYFQTNRFEDALAQYKQIIDQVANGESDYIITLINAHEFAGKCLQKLGDTSENSDYLNNERKSISQRQ